LFIVGAYQIIFYACATLKKAQAQPTYPETLIAQINFLPLLHFLVAGTFLFSGYNFAGVTFFLLYHTLHHAR
jgi:hypothetical protein